MVSLRRVGRPLASTPEITTTTSFAVAAFLTAACLVTAHAIPAWAAARTTVAARPQEESRGAGQQAADDKAKRAALPPLIFIRAAREKIYATLAEQLKEQKYKLSKKDEHKIVFSRRTPGAHAAVRRRRASGSLTSPITDAPTQSLAFILTAKGDGFVVAGRMLVNEVLSGTDVMTFDVSNRPAIRADLNKGLERLKAAAERGTR